MDGISILLLVYIALVSSFSNIIPGTAAAPRRRRQIGPNVEGFNLAYLWDYLFYGPRQLNPGLGNGGNQVSPVEITDAPDPPEVPDDLFGPGMVTEPPDLPDASDATVGPAGTTVDITDAPEVHERLAVTSGTGLVRTVATPVVPSVVEDSDGPDPLSDVSAELFPNQSVQTVNRNSANERTTPVPSARRIPGAVGLGTPILSLWRQLLWLEFLFWQRGINAPVK